MAGFIFIGRLFHVCQFTAPKEEVMVLLDTVNTAHAMAELVGLSSFPISIHLHEAIVYKSVQFF